jgi:allantoicase
MADGWETSRSRTEDHVDWVVVKLGVPGKVKSLVVDTAHFRGNFPEQAQIAGISDSSEDGPKASDEGWRDLTPLNECEGDKEHIFDCLDKDTVITHVKLSIYPDGGVKRLRVFGIRTE